MPFISRMYKDLFVQVLNCFIIVMSFGFILDLFITRRVTFLVISLLVFFSDLDQKKIIRHLRHFHETRYYTKLRLFQSIFSLVSYFSFVTQDMSFVDARRLFHVCFTLCGELIKASCFMRCPVQNVSSAHPIITVGLCSQYFRTGDMSCPNCCLLFDHFYFSYLFILKKMISYETHSVVT